MILLKRTIPLTLQQIIVVRSRLNAYHHKQAILEKSEARRWAGYRGELVVDKYLERFATDKFNIFQDLTLAEENEIFQLDTFLFNESFGLILDIKNILGTVYFDKYSKQMIRTYKGEKEGFLNPILQAQIHKMQLQKWLKKHKLPPIPIESLVVFSNPATIIETTPGNEQIFLNVIHANRLHERINELELKYNSPKINKSASKKFSQQLLSGNIPYLINILEKYAILHNEIKLGVRCPICNFVPMMRVSTKWHCPNCKTYSKNAHIPSIYDYLLLNQPTITNQQCREFLNISSPRTIRGFLSKFPMTGSKKGSSYHLMDLLYNSNEHFLLPKNHS